MKMLSIDEQTHLRSELTAWDKAEVERIEAAMVLSAAEREAWQALVDHVVAMGATLPGWTSGDDQGRQDGVDLLGAYDHTDAVDFLDFQRVGRLQRIQEVATLMAVREWLEETPQLRLPVSTGADTVYTLPSGHRRRLHTSRARAREAVVDALSAALGRHVASGAPVVCQACGQTGTVNQDGPANPSCEICGAALDAASLVPAHEETSETQGTCLSAEPVLKLRAELDALNALVAEVSGEFSADLMAVLAQKVEAPVAQGEEPPWDTLWRTSYTSAVDEFVAACKAWSHPEVQHAKANILRLDACRTTLDSLREQLDSRDTPKLSGPTASLVGRVMKQLESKSFPVALPAEFAERLETLRAGARVALVHFVSAAVEDSSVLPDAQSPSLSAFHDFVAEYDRLSTLAHDLRIIGSLKRLVSAFHTELEHAELPEMSLSAAGELIPMVDESEGADWAEAWRSHREVSMRALCASVRDWDLAARRESGAFCSHWDEVRSLIQAGAEKTKAATDGVKFAGERTWYPPARDKKPLLSSFVEMRSLLCGLGLEADEGLARFVGTEGHVLLRPRVQDAVDEFERRVGALAQSRQTLCEATEGLEETFRWFLNCLRRGGKGSTGGKLDSDVKRWLKETEKRVKAFREAARSWDDGQIAVAADGLVAQHSEAMKIKGDNREAIDRLRESLDEESFTEYEHEREMKSQTLKLEGTLWSTFSESFLERILPAIKGVTEIQTQTDGWGCGPLFIVFMLISAYVFDVDGFWANVLGGALTFLGGVAVYGAARAVYDTWRARVDTATAKNSAERRLQKAQKARARLSKTLATEEGRLPEWFNPPAEARTSTPND